jgi:hypothetical protein
MDGKIFVFKVALDEKIWRRIALRGNQTLDDLHEAIFQAFDRFDEHLYSFYFPKPGIRGRARLRDAVEYTHPMAAEEGPFEDERLTGADTAKISSLSLRPDRKFLYLFDFGDQWMHEITVENADGADDGGQYPRIVEKHGQSPAQYPDCDKE